MLKYIFLFILLFVKVYSPAQNTKWVKTDKYYDNHSYSRTIKKIESLNSKTDEVIRKLAESYAKTGNYSKSEVYYAELMKSNIRNSYDIYNYASVLAINKKYDDYDKWMAEFCKLEKNDTRAISFLKNVGFYYDLLLDKEQFRIKNIEINSNQNDFGTSYLKNNLVFASSRNAKSSIQRIWNWKQLPFSDLYMAEINRSNLTNLKKFPRSLNIKYREGLATFNEAGTLSVLTGNQYQGKRKNGVIKMQLFSSKFIDGKWSDPQPLPFNSSEYSVGHPALSTTGDTMFFASDMPGGFGGVDLYVTYKTSEGNWSKPSNLGNQINTEGNEMFPFIHKNGYFFFASDGLLGIGGLDVFYTKLQNKQFLKPKNIGVPINSNKDDFAFIMDDKLKSGFFSSNRDDGKGNDDIWSFTVLKELTFDAVLKGKTIDNDGRFLINTIVSLYDEDGNILKAVSSDDSGNYEFVIKPGINYELEAAKPKYVTDIERIESVKTDRIITKNLSLERIPDYALICNVTDLRTGEPLSDVKVSFTNNKSDKTSERITYDDGNFLVALDDYKIRDSLNFIFTLQKEGYADKTINYKEILNRTGEYFFHIEIHKIEVGEDLGRILNIKPIYFDFDKWNIRPDAALELDKIVKVMNEYPDMVIELSSHTDCRGASVYNLILSDRRAKISADYIKSRIKNPNRIYGDGFGETRLLNDCACEGGSGTGIDCSEEQHQQNRRTEFRIVKI